MIAVLQDGNFWIGVGVGFSIPLVVVAIVWLKVAKEERDIGARWK